MLLFVFPETGMDAKAIFRMGLWAIALSLVSLSGCSDFGRQPEAQAASDTGKKQNPGGGQPPGVGGSSGDRGRAAIPVKAERVTRADMNAYVETYARLVSERQISVLARRTGVVENLVAEEGNRVRKGQLLLRLDQVEPDLQLRQTRAALEEAKANYERFAILHAEKMVSQTEYETTRLRFENTKIRLEEAELNLTYTRVQAPISGVVTRRMVELGDLVRANQELFVIADLDKLLARIFIPERRMYQVRPGQEATIVVEALPERTFDGGIRMIGPEVIAESGTVKVTLEVPAHGLLKPGMFATIRIITGSRPQTLVIPKKALVLETDDDDVFVIREGEVRQVSIELGYVEDDRVEVVSGLDEGDQVVTVGHDGLKDGVAVRVVGERAELAAGEATGTPGEADGAGDSTQP